MAAAIQLSEADSKALRDATRAKRRAAVEAAHARSLAAVTELEYLETLERLAELHDFDAGKPMAFDDRAHTLTPVTPT